MQKKLALIRLARAEPSLSGVWQTSCLHVGQLMIDLTVKESFLLASQGGLKPLFNQHTDYNQKSVTHTIFLQTRTHQRMGTYLAS